MGKLTNKVIWITGASSGIGEGLVYELVKKEIVKMNKDLPPVAKIKKFINLYKEFDADDDELTRTRKLRRAFVEDRYKDIVNGLYSDIDHVHMDTTITYEDGRVTHIKADLKVVEVPQ